jgi:hypothetical protein
VNEIVAVDTSTANKRYKNNVKNKKTTNTYSIMKKFISQTPTDSNGDYTITYIDNNDVLITRNMNLFNI